MNLIINIFYNDAVFEEILNLIKNLNMPIGIDLLKIYQNSNLPKFNKFKSLINDFLNDSEDELWQDYKKLKEFTSKKKV